MFELYIKNGIVRKNDLETFNITFFDPEGNLIKEFIDNHLTYPNFNFNFDTTTGEILQNGFYNEPKGNDFPDLPIGFRSHLDVAFFTKTTAELLPDDPTAGQELGQRMIASKVPEPTTLLGLGLVSLMGLGIGKNSKVKCILRETVGKQGK